MTSLDCNATPAEGALARVLTGTTPAAASVITSCLAAIYAWPGQTGLCEVLPVPLPYRVFPLNCFVCYVYDLLPGSLDFCLLDYPLVCLLVGLITVILTSLPVTTTLIFASRFGLLNCFLIKLLQMDSNTASASPSLQNTSPPMNPAEVSQLQAAFAYQSEVLKGYQEQLNQLQSANDHLTHYIRSLPSPTPQTVRLAMPEKFDGSAEQCQGFIRQVEILFANQEEQFYSDEKKCAFLMSLLSGKAIDWAAAVWETERLFRTSYKYFVQQLRDVFEYPAGGKDISTQLLHMSQGNRTAADYAIEFRTLAAQSGWNDISLKAVFRQSLNFDLQTELACKGENR